MRIDSVEGFGDYIRALRKESGLKWSYVCYKSDLAQSTLNFIERGKCSPHLEKVIKILKAYGYSLYARKEHMIEVQLDDKAIMPTKAHDNDAGFDLYSRETQRITDCGGKVFDTGVHIAIPEGYVGYVQGRSGLNINHNIICPTGVVDSGYTGSIKVKLYNMDIIDYVVNPGDKIAQLVIQPIATYKLSRVNHLEDTDRGADGFGSSGR